MQTSVLKHVCFSSMRPPLRTHTVDHHTDAGAAITGRQPSELAACQATPRKRSTSYVRSSVNQEGDVIGFRISARTENQAGTSNACCHNNARRIHLHVVHFFAYGVSLDLVSVFALGAGLHVATYLTSMEAGIGILSSGRSLS
ncbi:hypothetical protein [Burkholderia pyrrocinia]|uniref:hypothetical protein n=1 Tax=Burkholderia pyrrocinia TaxID=60550 RepID=UPI0015896964|nr:hypothetical protein [Burkholderia pyrrocinia]